MKIDTSLAMPPMIDTHCHLDDDQFKDDFDEVIRNSREANVRRWILIGYDPDRWDSAIQMAKNTEGMVHTLGVHPACADQWTPAIETQLRDKLIDSRAVAIGEAGLDFYRDNAPFAIQATAFAGQLELAIELDLPLVIHMRSAENEMLELLSDGRALPTLLFHSFDGSGRLLEFVRSTRSYVGIGGLATRQKSAGLRELLTQVASDRIVLETDSPYLVPARQKVRRNQPAQIATIAMMMAEFLGTTPEELARQTTANAETLFGLQHV